VTETALLVLEDGSAYAGEALVGSGTVGGEVVFTTSMGGYQEIASDPSFAGQIVAYTFPMIGNYGVAEAFDESTSFHPEAIVAREITNYRFNHAAEGTWLEWLSRRGCMAVTGVDTRALTRHIRERGAMRAVLSTQTDDVGRLRSLAQRLPPMSGRDLASAVTCAAPYELSPGTDVLRQELATGAQQEPHPSAAPADEATVAAQPAWHVVVYDFGVKRSILRQLLARRCRLTVVPAHTSARAVRKLRPDGVVLSNGPGDPAALGYAVRTVKQLLGTVPLFGICLGHQLLALALDLPTYKLPFGHRGANHPVKDVQRGTVAITTQNHGFAVRLPDERVPLADVHRRHGSRFVVTHLSLYDGTVEGLECPERYAFSVQYHPEAAPGPHDASDDFDRFVALMRDFRGQAGE